MWNRFNNEPVDHTCPLIDDVKGFIESIDWDLNDSDEADLDKEGKRVAEVLETIRDANSKLRKWGNELDHEKDELEKDKESLEKEVSNLESRIKELERELKDSEDEVEEYRDKCVILEDELNSK